MGSWRTSEGRIECPASTCSWERHASIADSYVRRAAVYFDFLTSMGKQDSSNLAGGHEYVRDCFALQLRTGSALRETKRCARDDATGRWSSFARSDSRGRLSPDE